MSPTLPRTIALKLEQTLAQWRHWHCEPPLSQAPEIIEILTGGISNHSVRVRSGEDFVVRIDGINPTQIGLNRQGEYRSLQDAHRASLAPCPRYFNPDLGSLVCDFLPADAPSDPSRPPSTEPTTDPFTRPATYPSTDPALESEQDLAAIGKLLRGIHALPPRRHRLDHAERLLRYEKIIEHKSGALGADLLATSHQVQGIVQQLKESSREALVLCHNDLLAANRLTSGGQLWAIDWEYSAMGSRWYDLAVTIEGDELNAHHAKLLVKRYLGRASTKQERQQLNGFGCIYRYLELLWYLAHDTQGQSQGFIAEKSSVLRERLALLD